MDQHMHWILSQGRPVMLNRPRSGVLTGFALSQQIFFFLFFYVTGCFSQKPYSQHSACEAFWCMWCFLFTLPTLTTLYSKGCLLLLLLFPLFLLSLSVHR